LRDRSPEAPLAVPVDEDRRLQPGGELRHRRGPLRQAAEAGVQPCRPSRGGSAGRAAGADLPSDEPLAAGAPICSRRLQWLWTGHGRQQPVPSRRRELPRVGCHAGDGGGRTVDRAVPQRTCPEKQLSSTLFPPFF